jgi:CHAT domain-containing protein
MDAEAHLLALKDESERLLVVDTAAAERLADELVEAAERLDSPRFKALGWMAQGDVRRAQGRYPEAVALYEAGGQACLALGDEIGWARSRTGWVFASHFCGRGREALPIAERAYDVLAHAGEHLRAGGLSNNMAGVCYQLGEYERALAVFDRAIVHFQQTQLADERIARVKANKALTLALLGRFPEAIDMSVEARDIFLRHGEVAAAWRADQYRASIYAGQGRYTEALRIQIEAQAAFEEARLDEAAIQVAFDMIGSYAGLNRHAEALALAEDLARRCEAVGTPTEAAKARFRAAQAHAEGGDTESARRLLDGVSDVFALAGLTPEVGAVALLRARLHLQAQEWSASLKAAETAHQVFAERGLRARSTQAELIRARALLKLGRAAEAETLAAEALRTSAELNAAPLTHEAHYQLAHLAQAQGQRARAFDEYEAAMRDLEQVQRSLTTALRTEFLGGDKLRVYKDAIIHSLLEGEVERAFGYLERAKSRSIVDYLLSMPEVRVNARTEAEQQLIHELARLRQEHNWFYGRLHGLGPSGHADRLSDAERATLREAIDERERRITHLNQRLSLLREAAGLEALGGPGITSMPSPPQLEDGTLLLEYAFTSEIGVAFVLSPNGLRVVNLDLGTRKLRQLLTRWQLNVESAAHTLRADRPLEPLRANALGHLSGLYQALIAPVAAHLEGVERLIVVPFGPAHGVPFHALFDGQRHLIERAEVWTSPSSSLFELCAQRVAPTTPQPLVIGYSGGRLPFILDEARSVSGLLGGSCYLEEQATCEVVMAEASHRGILHLAAHGEARLDNPGFAHLSLADGQLEMSDVLTLRLDGALVTLSGCETGRSAVVGGDELVGLSRGFLFAGASTLVQSLWRVEDASTGQLMKQFYSGLCRGLAPGPSLRHAQRAFLEDGLHPYVWAPFQLVGYGGAVQRFAVTHPQEVHVNATTGVETTRS